MAALLATLLSCSMLLPALCSAQPGRSPSRHFTIVYSADERGEVTPCG